MVCAGPAPPNNRGTPEKRLHINLPADDLERSIGFYLTLVAEKQSVVKHDCTKWMLDDPCVNLAIQTRGAAKGIDHLGIQVEHPTELRDVLGRLHEAEGRIIEDGQTTRCYSKSEKTWIFAPQGVAWETFYTIGDRPIYGRDTDPTVQES